MKKKIHLIPSPRATVLAVGAALAVDALARGERLGISDALYEKGINFIDKRPGLKKSGLGKKASAWMESQLRNNAFRDFARGITTAPIQMREPIQTEMVMPREWSLYDPSTSTLEYNFSDVAEAKPFDEKNYFGDNR